MKARKIEVQKLGTLVSNYVKEHAAEILTGAGVVGVIFTALAAYKAYPKVEEALKDLDDDATTLEKVVAVAPEVASPVVVGTISIGCIIGSNVVSTKRLVAVTACYKAIDEAYKSYKDKDKEVAGESHVKHVESLVEDDREDMSKLVHAGLVICEERDTGRVFYSSIQAIQKACTLAVTDNWPPFPIDNLPIEIPLNDIYEWLGIKKTKYGEQCFSLFDPHIEIEYDGGVLENGEPYISFWFPQLSQGV